jgi:hypothetical protein
MVGVQLADRLPRRTSCGVLGWLALKLKPQRSADTGVPRGVSRDVMCRCVWGPSVGRGSFALDKSRLIVILCFHLFY